MQRFYTELLYSINEDNAAAIVEYITAMKNEVNLSDHYKKDLIILLCKFCRDNKNKLFKDLTRTDIISFLDTYRKTEAADPMHKWIGTYNLYRIHLLRFFKWLYLQLEIRLLLLSPWLQLFLELPLYQKLQFEEFRYSELHYLYPTEKLLSY